MKTIHYAGGELLTGDDIADAVVHYAEALARKNTSAAVEIPSLLPDGNIVQVSLLLGPASQLVLIPQPSIGDEITAVELVKMLNAQAARLGDPRPLTSDGPADFEHDGPADFEHDGSADFEHEDDLP